MKRSHKQLLSDIVRPAIYKGQKLEDYGVDKKTGDIYSFKSGTPHKMVWFQRNKKNLNQSYPSSNFYDRKLFKNQCKYKSMISVHIIVQETLCPLPVPPGVTKTEWKKTPKSVKNVCRGLWMVNHIDHNKQNFHPSNLEWVLGAAENAQKAKAHYSALKSMTYST